MTPAPLSRTNTSLLGRLRQAPADQQAWAEFVQRYGPKIYGWCRRWQLQEADAQDVTQDVLLKLARKMRDFAYDPQGSFHGWLKTLTHHAWRDFVDGRQRHQGACAGGEREGLETLQARDDLSRSLQEGCDRGL